MFHFPQSTHRMELHNIHQILWNDRSLQHHSAENSTGFSESTMRTRSFDDTPSYIMDFPKAVPSLQMRPVGILLLWSDYFLHQTEIIQVQPMHLHCQKPHRSGYHLWSEFPVLLHKYAAFSTADQIHTAGTDRSRSHLPVLPLLFQVQFFPFSLKALPIRSSFFPHGRL